ncbi:MAG TPA: TolC family protein [Bryobacteraceae bacterium]|nr:TolC family protein [Bryobacteraceae bacterium]
MLTKALTGLGLCHFFLGAFFLAGQTASDQAPKVVWPDTNHWYDRFAGPYEPRTVPPPSFENSTRIDSLMRAGKLYLSLQDAINLALENNLDIEVRRYNAGIASSDTLRAQGGALLRGIDLTVNELPQGVGGPASPLINAQATGATPATAISTNLIEQTAIAISTTNPIVTGTTPLATGPAIPIFDPAVVGQLNWQHLTTPQVNSVVAGTDALVSRNFVGSLGLSKGFGAGTQLSATFNSNNQDTNSFRNTYNPYTSSSLGFGITQPLLRGFGLSVNRRFIRIAKNNEKISDLAFQHQVIETVAGVIRLYFDLVSLIDDVAVKQKTLELAQQLYNDNKQKVEQGTLAPIELVRAQAQVAASRQDLANSQGFELEQELIIKTVLTKRGTADPLIREARIVATTPIDIPAQEEVRPVQDLVSEAFRNRPEIQEAQLQIANSQISLRGSRNGLLPELDIVGAAQNSGLGGALNPLAPATSPGSTGLITSSSPTFLGGFGSSLGQIFARNYPTYGIGLQLTLPVHNRIAQGDYVRDQMQLRQSEVRSQQLEDQVRLDVESSLIALQRTRGAYDAAVEARKLQEQSLQIEMEKYANGVSTTFLVMQYQSLLAQARSTEVAARSVYVKARTALERSVGETLPNHSISIDEVFHGKISAAPATLPVLGPGGGR